MMNIAPVRKSVPTSVKTFFKAVANDPESICAYCGLPINGRYHISHVIPVSSYGDCLPKRTYVALHPECNEQLGTQKLTLKYENSLICEV